MRAGPAWTNRSQTVFMQLTYQKLKPFALSYLTAPLAVFFAGYLRAPFAVAGLAVLAFAWWYAVCKTPQVKQVGQEAFGAKAGAAVCPDAVVGLPGRSDGLFLPELGLGLPQRHLPGSDHKQLAGVLPAKGYGAGVLYRALAGPGGADQTDIRPVWAGCRLDVRPYGPLGVDGAGHLSGGAEFVGLPACRYRQKAGDRPAVFDFLQRHGYSGRAVQQPTAGPAGL